MTRLIIATRNAHKTREIQEILQGDFEFLNLRQFQNAPEAIEDAATFAGNAVKKARTLAEWIGQASPSSLGLSENGGHENKNLTYVLADDSGLEVDALGGAPGVHSARFAALETGAKGNAPDAANNAKLLALLKDVPREKRTARFRCVLAMIPARWPNGPVASQSWREADPLLFEGACEGQIAFAEAGAGGFGYDPLFIPDGRQCSFAELGEDAKNAISHRAAALRALKQYLTGIVGR